VTLHSLSQLRIAATIRTWEGMAGLNKERLGVAEAELNVKIALFS